MNGERVVVRGVSWRDLLPWLVLFRSFAVAKSLPVLLLGTAGALLTPLGWYVAEAVFVEDGSRQDRVVRYELEQNRMPPGEPGALPVPDGGSPPRVLWELLDLQADSLHPIFWRFVRPGEQLVSGELQLTMAAYYTFGLLWMLVVWGLLGGAITRIACLRLGREEGLGLRAALQHARKRWGSYIVAPLFPLLGVFLTALPLLVAGLLVRLDVGVLLTGLGWLLILLGGLLMTILLLGLLFGWPLMWATISSERNGDAFEAFSRSYSYTFQRPLHYLFYALVSVLFGGLAWTLVYHVTEAVIHFAEWPVALAAGQERWQTIRTLAAEPGFDGTTLHLGARLIGIFNGLARSLATGFGYSFFWCLATAIYLLLRRDVDHTELDEVFVEDPCPPAEPVDKPGPEARQETPGEPEGPGEVEDKPA